MRVEPIDRAKRFDRGTAQDVGFLKANVDTGMRQGRIVVRAKGIEPFRVDFRRSVAAQQPIFEKDAHFRHHRRAVGMARCGNLDAREQIFLSIRAQLPEGQLTAGDHDGLGQIFEHKTQGRSRESHGVRTVEQDETVVAIIVLRNDLNHATPILRFHIRGVDRRAESHGVDLVVKAIQLRHKVADMFPIESLERPGNRILEHTDGSAGVDDEYAGCVHKLCFDGKFTKII